MSLAESINTVQDRDLTLIFVDLALHPMLKVPAYFFEMTHTNTDEEIGRINLRAQTTSAIELYAGHIGYSVHMSYRGHHYAARS
ncbi:MAG TPA: GNAT family N-acetyltransferase, partial [Pseudacidobacterium sp.]|nr:GNAT family N-acetyltransferase [Pseudacidobacterium sp.]